jgi:hypothetical protein
MGVVVEDNYQDDRGPRPSRRDQCCLGHLQTISILQADSLSLETISILQADSSSLPKASLSLQDLIHRRPVCKHGGGGGGATRARSGGSIDRGWQPRQIRTASSNAKGVARSI